MTDSTGMALILTPREGALVQDLGRFRSGVLLETDILPGSAMLSRIMEDGTPEMLGPSIRFSFAGSALGYHNINNFRDKAEVAAGRLDTRYPSIAYGYAPPEDLNIVGKYDLRRKVITEVTDMDNLAAWAGEDPELILPSPATSGTRDPLELARLLKASHGVTLLCPPMISRLANGQIYYQNGGDMGWIYDPDDPALAGLLEADDIPQEIREKTVLC